MKNQIATNEQAMARFEETVEMALAAVSGATPENRRNAEEWALESAKRLTAMLENLSGESRRGVIDNTLRAIDYGKSGQVLNMWHTLRLIENWVTEDIKG